MKELGVFLDQVDKTLQSMNPTGEETFFYRGHADNTYPLLPTIFRKSATAPFQFPYSFDNENTLFCNFKQKAAVILGSHRTEMDVIFNMQHHGLPTRLLDWSTSLGVALYFALKERSNNDPCIWILAASSLNKHAIGQQGIIASSAIVFTDQGPNYKIENNNWNEKPIHKVFDFPIALLPATDNLRAHMQHSVFTIHGKNHNPIETMGLPCVKKIILPANVIASAKKLLTLMGINEFSLFPDLDGLARFIIRAANERHGPKT